MHGYDVTVAGSVPEALAAIHSKQFDVLLADLNIGQPGDGFTVVSAMRRTQPKVVTLILTGYPAFDHALEAIRQQVDGFVVKPTDVEQLLSTIERAATAGHENASAGLYRLAQLLTMQREELARGWSRALKGTTAASSVAADRQRRAAAMVGALLRTLEKSKEHSAAAADIAREHGRQRKEEGRSLPMLL